MPPIPRRDPSHPSNPTGNPVSQRRSASRPGDPIVSGRQPRDRRDSALLKAPGLIFKTVAPVGIRVLLLLLLSTTTVLAGQNPCPDPGGNVPMNPQRVCMTPSADHVDIDGYAIDLVRKADDTVAQTIDMGKPPVVTTADGSDWIDWNNLNVMPRAFGAYYSVVRAYGGGVSGPDSIASNDWDRVPGRPGGPRVVRGLKWLGKGMWAGLKHTGRGARATVTLGQLPR